MRQLKCEDTSFWRQRINTHPSKSGSILTKKHKPRHQTSPHKLSTPFPRLAKRLCLLYEPSPSGIGKTTKATSPTSKGASKRARLTMQRAHASEGRPSKRRRRKSAIMAFFCPGDQSGPRILTLLREFESVATVESHNKWIRLLHSACERQRCHVSECSPGDYFSQTHGAKTLVNAITMFLTYFVPRKVMLRSDDEWREVLAALRTFHDFCVRRDYVKADPVLMTALYRLRKFRICSIPERLEQLAEEKYWDGIERAQMGRASKPVWDSGDVGTGSTAVDGEGSSRIGGVGGENVQEDEESYEMFLGDEEPLCVDQIVDDGWVINSEDSDGGERCKAFLHLPEDLAKLGMQGMSLSCMKLALRNGVWRPIRNDGIFVANAYPPDDVFYY